MTWRSVKHRRAITPDLAAPGVGLRHSITGKFAYLIDCSAALSWKGWGATCQKDKRASSACARVAELAPVCAPGGGRFGIVWAVSPDVSKGASFHGIAWWPSQTPVVSLW